jgi:flagellar L-ring protein precursor FlgH
MTQSGFRLSVPGTAAILVAIVLLIPLAEAARAADDPPAAAQASPVRSDRAAWLSDRLGLREGDIVTVIIDEQTSAHEQVTQTGTDQHNVTANLSATSDGESAMGNTGFGSKWSADSREGGQADRRGDLTGVLSAAVLSVDAHGVAEIEGHKTVTIDGRTQEITLRGKVRTEDLSSNNVVFSSRLADAAISYKGKKMSAKKGIIGKIVSMLWPF